MCNTRGWAHTCKACERTTKVDVVTTLYKATKDKVEIGLEAECRFCCTVVRDVVIEVPWPNREEQSDV